MSIIVGISVNKLPKCLEQAWDDCNFAMSSKEGYRIMTIDNREVFAENPSFKRKVKR